MAHRGVLVGLTATFLATFLVGAVLIVTFLTVNVLFLVWLERKVAAHIHRRVGPMEAGPLLMPVAADRFGYLVAPLMVFLPTLCVASLIPLSGTEAFADMPYGLLVIFALSGLTVLAIFMAGWSSNNKHALLGGMRSVAQVVAYKIPILLSALTVVLLSQTMNLRHIVEAQQNTVWYVLLQPVATVIYFIGITALVAGFHTEYSGMRFAMFYFAEYTNMLVLGALGATLFFGGWLGPWLPGPVWLLLKAYAGIVVMMWMRWTFPRLRFDQLMSLAWKLLIPAALVNLAVTAVLVHRAG